VNQLSLLIFTDLDGTLLDGQTYDFSPALPALSLIRSLKIPLILVSSKTRAEIEDLRKRLSLEDPFIAENGGGVFFPGTLSLPEDQDYRQVKGYKLVLTGRPIDEVLSKAIPLKREYDYTGFSEMSARAIAAQTGLSLREAGLAARREFDEPIVLKNPGHREMFCKKANDLGLECVEGGRFIHLFIGRIIRFEVFIGIFIDSQISSFNNLFYCPDYIFQILRASEPTKFFDNHSIRLIFFNKTAY